MQSNRYGLVITPSHVEMVTVILNESWVLMVLSPLGTDQLQWIYYIGQQVLINQDFLNEHASNTQKLFYKPEKVWLLEQPLKLA